MKTLILSIDLEDRLKYYDYCLFKTNDNNTVRKTNKYYYK
jgi:hypothetical protein